MRTLLLALISTAFAGAALAAEATKAGKTPAKPVDTPACADPGPFVPPAAAPASAPAPAPAAKS
ncbi:hypothetical protein [Piscinibacter sp.]|uniref:hypothetical protein n=1 Tax=Piscinibacter sp. TaxID=1903157 RepID=UPI0037830BA9